MAADNWDRCPKCAKTIAVAEQGAHEEFATRIAAVYGKVPVDEYQQEYNAANDALGRRLMELTTAREAFTLREDYNLGITNDGYFGVTYKASCVTCRFSFTYEFQDRVKL